jgi:hypothetical protein
MEIEVNPRRRPYRLVSGEPAVVEKELNDLSSEYTVTAWNFATCSDRVVITAICISTSILRQAQLAAATMPPNGRR